uniref:Uncharacterized protein n=1 Tax=Arundo donax TaxID=35708 RepID=A0A0A8ZHC1_ARUDO
MLFRYGSFYAERKNKQSHSEDTSSATHVEWVKGMRPIHPAPIIGHPR